MAISHIFQMANSKQLEAFCKRQLYFRHVPPYPSQPLFFLNYTDYSILLQQEKKFRHSRSPWYKQASESVPSHACCLGNHRSIPGKKVCLCCSWQHDRSVLSWHWGVRTQIKLNIKKGILWLISIRFVALAFLSLSIVHIHVCMHISKCVRAHLCVGAHMCLSMQRLKVDLGLILYSFFSSRMEAVSSSQTWGWSCQPAVQGSMSLLFVWNFEFQAG